VVLVSGLSGIIPAAIFCHKHSKTLVVLRKEGEHCHGEIAEGPWDWPKKRYIIIDDFMSGGHTMSRLVSYGMYMTMRPPEFVLFYETRKLMLSETGANGLRLRREWSNRFIVISYPTNNPKFTINRIEEGALKPALSTTQPQASEN